MVYEMTSNAFAIAAEAFINIEDTGRVPHILNCIEIYNTLKDMPEYVQVAGILHDITYRTSWTLSDLANEDILSNDALELIKLVTPRGDKSNFLSSAYENRFACYICLANLRYHMNLGEHIYLGSEDLKIIQNYSNTYQMFKESLLENHYV